ncbi:MAG: hydrogenase maturation protein [Xanthobacteraceae bacterium]|nr:hydrogenase maturation protein [Xanthobacteraceae bacterium]
MRILLLTHSFNSLTQRIFVELTARGHEVAVEFDVHDDLSRQAVELFKPDVVIATFLRRAIPEDIWRSVCCLVVHPGIPGDRGPAALDWAILEQPRCWGVTVLEADAEMDAGPVWAASEFPMREASKSSLYRREVANAAVAAVLDALTRKARNEPPQPRMTEGDPRIRVRGPCAQRFRAIDWSRDTTEAAVRKIRSADGTPGLVDEVFGEAVRLYDAHPAYGLHGEPGTAIARCDGAIARATIDGAVWIGHVRKLAPLSLKLPAADVFPEQADRLPPATNNGYQPIRYEESGAVGYLHFDFYNGAMSTRQCEALREAYRAAVTRPTRLLVLMGGADTWSNGIHLGQIEGASSPADESWHNINAIDDLVRDIILTTDRIIVSMLRMNAGAGGVFLALAADEVWACDDVVLNPHYKDMGNLYGSEYWTYLLPRRAGRERAERVAQARLPMGAEEARRLGLVDRIIPRSNDLTGLISQMAGSVAADDGFATRIEIKKRERDRDEREKPLEAYRAEELARMRSNFYGFDPSYHVARYNFIHKVPKSRTPLTIAPHRARRGPRPRSAVTG